MGLVIGCAVSVDLRAQEQLEPEAAAADEIGILRSARDNLVAAEDFVGARGPAERVISSLEETPEGPLANDILHLARIQAELQEFDAAEANFLRAIEMLETSGGEYSTALIAPYHALGRTYINSRRFPEAVAVLEQAQHISQRSAGLFNVEQSDIIDDMTMAHLGLGNTVEARSLQLQRLDNAVRRFGADDPRVIPFHNHLGDYYDRSRLRLSAREQYAKVLSIQEQQAGVDDSSLLPTVRKLMQIDLLLGRSEETKARLDKLLANPEVDAHERALSLAVLGDWAIVQEDPELARQYYADAYLALQRQDAAQAEGLFAKPTMIDFIPPLSPVDRGTRSRRPYAWGSIVLEFDVSADGRASEVRTVSANPPDLLDTAYSRRIREAHFRPRLVASEPVATSDVQLTHYVRLYVRDDDDEEEEPESAEQEAADEPGE
jgi:tetratricopeptide (TPR) repeat protein